jgi:hypothetical protein
LMMKKCNVANLGFDMVFYKRYILVFTLEKLNE